MKRKEIAWIFQTANKRNLIRETKSFLKAAQNNAIRSNYVKTKINKTQQNNKWR